MASLAEVLAVLPDPYPDRIAGFAVGVAFAWVVWFAGKKFKGDGQRYDGGGE